MNDATPRGRGRPKGSLSPDAKQNYTMRLTPDAIAAAKALGASRVSELLVAALASEDSQAANI